jgi:glutamate-ammonia-ligase adenylyltransferase
MRSQTGVLYAVDTRLRPSGTAGLLVSHIDAFVDYQRTRAWTWEHQALLRARILYANKTIRKKFTHLKQDVLFLSRDRHRLRDDVLNMRAKINKYMEHNAVKHVAGGLLDLEFLVQFLILAYPQGKFARRTNTLSQLQQLFAQNILNDVQFRVLKRAYRHYHRVLHQHLLQSDVQTIEHQQVEVVAICDDFYALV